MEEDTVGTQIKEREKGGGGGKRLRRRRSKKRGMGRREDWVGEPGVGRGEGGK